jgi:hypothetical protein
VKAAEMKEGRKEGKGLFGDDEDEPAPTPAE